ncbi:MULTISPECIES: DUF6723 family protein [unclassified Caballeronia]|uniref:DUF6723 family protein n=1 Tax=unclassified Caballeronia TaxID=2646786 RepID=UPI00286CD440|nr:MULTISPECIES: DUF6723 family protein [unclassified Caballeronia]
MIHARRKRGRAIDIPNRARGGADEIGPCASKNAAREAAIERGDEIVAADLRSPEL